MEPVVSQCAKPSEAPFCPRMGLPLEGPRKRVFLWTPPRDLSPNVRCYKGNRAEPVQNPARRGTERAAALLTKAPRCKPGLWPARPSLSEVSPGGRPRGPVRQRTLDGPQPWTCDDRVRLELLVRVFRPKSNVRALALAAMQHM